MGFKRTAEGRVFFETPHEQSPQQPSESAGASNIQVTGLLKALNERLKEAQVERGRLIRELDEVRKTLSDMSQRTERAERAYMTLEQQVSHRESEAFKKADRAERAAKETLGDMLDARNSLSDLRERTQTREKELTELHEQIAAGAKLIEDVRKRQAIIEKFQREHGEKMVDHVAAYVTLSKRVSETQTGFESLDNKIGEVAARQDGLDRKLEKMHEERIRMMRKIDRIEDAVIQTRDTLNAKAMVVLADPNAAAFQQARIESREKTRPEPAQPQRYEDLLKEAPQTEKTPETPVAEELKREPVLLKNRVDEDDASWWQKPAVQTGAIALVLLAGVAAGWVVTELKNPAGSRFELLNRIAAQVAPAQPQTQSEPQASAPADQAWTPVEPQTAPEESAQQDQYTVEQNPQAAETILDNWNQPQEAQEPQEALPEVTTAPQAGPDASDDIGMIDLNNEDSVAEALEKNPEQLAAQLNAIEPGDNRNIETPAPAEEQVALAQPQETVAAAPAPAKIPAPQAKTQIPAIKPAAPDRAEKQSAPAPQTKAQPQPTGKVVTDIQPDETLPARAKEIEFQALAGVPEAQHDLAALYTAGSAGVAQNYGRAAQWFRKAADNGVANARYNLGVLYQQGLGVERSLEEAIKWYSAAAAQGHPEAQYNLGIAYIEGVGVPYDPEKAAGYFEYAATHNINEAAYNLGLIYENGLLGQPNPSEALRWYKQAAEGGSAEAKAALEQMAKNLGVKSGAASSAPAQGGSAKIASTTRAQSANDGALTAQIQGQLMRLGLYPGPADGIGGPLTSDAIRSYQAMNGLAVNGEASSALLADMKQKDAAVQ